MTPFLSSYRNKSSKCCISVLSDEGYCPQSSIGSP